MINAIETRYELAIYYYTAFHRHRVTNQAVVRPVFDYEKGEFVKDQVFIGDRLMAKAIVHNHVKEAEVYLPDFGSGNWYERHSSTQHNSGSTITIDCEITQDSQVPIFVKGGSVIPEFFDVRKQR